MAGHGRSHNVVYPTARTDFLDLKARGVLELKKRGRTMVFTVRPTLRSGCGAWRRSRSGS